MANVHAAIKEIRKSARKREKNQAVLSELKTLWKKLVGAIHESPLQGSAKTSKASPLAQELTSKWDHAVSRGIVPKGRANRKKARIAHFLKKAS